MSLVNIIAKTSKLSSEGFPLRYKCEIIIFNAFPIFNTQISKLYFYKSAWCYAGLINRIIIYINANFQQLNNKTIQRENNFQNYSNW